MMQLGLLLTPLVPLALAALWPARACRPLVSRLALLAPLPGLVFAAFGEEVAMDLPWLLLGARWGLDLTGRVFLGFTSACWLAAGVYARTYLAHDAARPRFELFYLLTLTGNLGVTISQDVGSFLLFFTLTSVAAYGLITHNREPASLYAGRVYIILVMIGEVLLFWGILLAAQQAGTLRLDELAEGLAQSPLRNMIAGLLLVGFGIKLGVMPLHFWLPLAHPAAPTPASAVLSGAIIKTGLLGWLRFLPLGAVALPEWGAVCVVAGVATAFLAVLFGLTQNNPKTVLAYSSVSQMGLITVGVGAGLMAPAAWTTIQPALLLYAAHHAIAKSSLFLGVGVVAAEMRFAWQRRLVTAGLILAALSLAGLPLTTGLVAKTALKYVAAAAPDGWAEVLHTILPASGLMTSLLVSHFLWLVWPGRTEPHEPLTAGLSVPWGTLTAGGIVLFVVWRWQRIINPAWLSLDPADLWSAMWPMLLAGVVVLVLHSWPALAAWLARMKVPAGDVVVPLNVLISEVNRLGHRWAVIPLGALVVHSHRRAGHVFGARTQRQLDRLAAALESDLSAGLFIGLLTALVFALLMR